jgi:hypothetical protein
MVEFLVLVNQIICKFKSSASNILEDVFPTVASRLSMILSQDAFSAGPASNTEVMLIVLHTCICKQAHEYNIIFLLLVSFYLLIYLLISIFARMAVPLKQCFLKR